MKTLPLILLCATAPILHAQPAKPEAAAEVAKEKGPIAEILGRPIEEAEREQLTALILAPLLDQYMLEKKILLPAREVIAFLTKSEEIAKANREGFAKDKQRLEEELKSTTLSKDDRARKEQELAMTEDLLKSTGDDGGQRPKDPEEVKMAREMVRTWKINHALYKQYGGRVIFQQAGPEPIDAYRDFLREQEAKGAFRIADEKAKEAFWKYFTDDKMHTFLDEKEGAKMMETPWWLQEKPAGE